MSRGVTGVFCLVVRTMLMDSSWLTLYFGWPNYVIAEKIIVTVVEVAKSLRRESFDYMTAQNVQELLLEEEIDEAGLVEMISEIHDNSEEDSIGENEVK
ncbi:hypothetical protein CEXT_322621 [Caerostris extrusa]|uniref:Uncharacterized protein n=1 Tax=Caerostris extrusa TaxID=172846 RepID=A0AAV4W241_CAEEX|nr:hypothetical protein CEXT_322621 [Caerostris extrusa]